MNRNETNWHFITNHGLVLSYIANNPSHTAREISMEVNITERTTHKIIKDLQTTGYIQKEKQGRNNSYTIENDLRLRHPSKDHISISKFLEALSLDPTDYKKHINF